MPDMDKKKKAGSLVEQMFKKMGMKKKKIKPKIKLNPNHPTGKAIMDRRKKMKEILDAS